MRQTGSGAHTASRARSYGLKAHFSSTPPRKQPELQDDPPHLRRNAEPPQSAERTVIRNAARTTRAGKGAAAAPEVKRSRIDIKSMLFSILIIVVFCSSGLRTEQKMSFPVLFLLYFIETDEST